MLSLARGYVRINISLPQKLAKYGSISKVYSSLSSSGSTNNSSDKSIIVVGADATVMNIVEKVLKENGLPNTKGYLTTDIDAIVDSVQKNELFLIILGGAVPQYPEVGRRINEAVIQYSPNTIIHQVAMTPQAQSSTVSTPSPSQLTDIGNKIAQSNLAIAKNYLQQNK